MAAVLSPPGPGGPQPGGPQPGGPQPGGPQPGGPQPARAAAGPALRPIRWTEPHGTRTGLAPTARADLLAAVADRVPVSERGLAVRVAVDGRDGAGKTVFADELAAVLRARGRPVVRASVDGFHQPRAVRYRRGRRSAQGYWLDAYDHGRLVAELLDPLGPGGSGRVRTAVHDVRTDAALDLAPVVVEPGAVLLLDGVFLHRDELVDFWDFSIYLHVDKSVAFRRMAVRDGTPADPADPANARYAGAQRLYAAACEPAARAAVVIDNTDLAAPRPLRGRK